MEHENFSWLFYPTIHVPMLSSKLALFVIVRDDLPGFHAAAKEKACGSSVLLPPSDLQAFAGWRLAP